jgi:hypothetical protein
MTRLLHTVRLATQRRKCKGTFRPRAKRERGFLAWQGEGRRALPQTSRLSGGARSLSWLRCLPAEVLAVANCLDHFQCQSACNRLAICYLFSTRIRQSMRGCCRRRARHIVLDLLLFFGGATLSLRAKLEETAVLPLSNNSLCGVPRI